MRLFGQIRTLARRSILNTFRQPAVISSILFPLLFMAVTSAGAGGIANVPGFKQAAKCAGNCSYLDFYISSALAQGTLFGGIGAGAALATDIELGFIRRLLLTPLQRPAILVGLAGGAMAIGGIQAIVVLGVAAIAGVHIQAGIAGAVAVIGLAILVSLAFSAIGALVAAITGSSEATQTIFPLFFIIMIFSSYFTPRPFLSGWFKWVATYNPATYVIEAIRSPVVTGWSGRALLPGLAAIFAIAALGFGGAVASLRSRMSKA